MSIAQEKPSKSDCNAPLTKVMQRNIAAILASRKRAEARKTWGDRAADAMTRFTGSMTFVWLHVIWFSLWILGNLGLAGLPALDPFPFGLLTMIVSLEAIFLSTFVLISQNRTAELDNRRSDLDVQIDLLAEHEVTRILCLVAAIAKKLDVKISEADEELEQDVDPAALLAELERKVDA